MGIRHLIVPSSFFPSIGGAQGSLLNFINAFPTGDEVYLFLGVRGFLFSLFKKRKFNLTIPFYSKLLSGDAALICYLVLLRILVRPHVIWLYGGGLTAARILKHRGIFGNKVKFILRSMGEDIQHDQYSDYGYAPNSEERHLISSAYLLADTYWALGNEISNLYQKIGVPKRKIFEIGNIVSPPGLPLRRTQGRKIRIGVIGRGHKKKNFELLTEIVPCLSSERYEFHLKISGDVPKLRGDNVVVHKPSEVLHLEYWPPDDVWDFYKNIDVLLVLSRIESFGNVTFEAGLMGAIVVINRAVSGAALARDCGLRVETFNGFSASNIVDALQSVKVTRHDDGSLPSNLNRVHIENMIKAIKNA